MDVVATIPDDRADERGEPLHALGRAQRRFHRGLHLARRAHADGVGHVHALHADEPHIAELGAASGREGDALRLRRVQADQPRRREHHGHRRQDPLGDIVLTGVHPGPLGKCQVPRRMPKRDPSHPVPKPARGHQRLTNQR